MHPKYIAAVCAALSLTGAARAEAPVAKATAPGNAPLHKSLPDATVQEVSLAYRMLDICLEAAARDVRRRRVPHP